MEKLSERLSPEHNKTECRRSVNAVRDALYVLGGKWKLPILVVLEYGPQRFTEVQRQIEGITPKLLSKELKELEMNGFVTRRVQPTTPVLIEYELTEYATSLQGIFAALRDWGIQHQARVRSL
ncbi:putative HTH-type transcriptional regulator ytcD [Fibrisoma limi BUZ 3]|uniref:Putative HTH-type transcriptional regulator ytcD n=1 Tax=Fibrisoma limi BUZ 3 TaxID=1185876 RepID=I2GG74_9BACT|nr:helix-turn-helix domain-containing protein [Fibrisoma limi]CCH52899.1 putative HTH-type transcriptional regulator ytcD [Fibrisoma limi BUZ 3]